MIITVAGEHRAAHPPELGTLTVRIAVEDADAAADFEGDIRIFTPVMMAGIGRRPG